MLLLVYIWVCFLYRLLKWSPFKICILFFSLISGFNSYCFVEHFEYMLKREK